jgi:hypothetical protein
MLVAGLLVALRLGACDDINIDIGDSSWWRREVAAGNQAPTGITTPSEYTVEFCGNVGGNVVAAPLTAFHNANHCLVSDAYECCGGVSGQSFSGFTYTASMCLDASEAECKTIDNTVASDLRWCGVATTAETGLPGLAAGVAAGAAAFVVLTAATAS